MELLITAHSLPQPNPEQHILGGICLTQEVVNNEKGTLLQLPLPLLEQKSSLRELFLIDATPEQIRFSIPNGAVIYSKTREFVFGHIEVEQHSGIKQLEETSQQAYRTMLQLCQDMQTFNLLRIWNYIPHINAPEGMTERYRLFNIGRRKAFNDYPQVIHDHYPAACALGSFDNILRIVFLASTHKPHYIENPRQISSCFYPEQYGSVPPLFSRATLFSQNHCVTLFISGTASIVGHKSNHIGDIQAQTRETLHNLNTVLTQANIIMTQEQMDYSYTKPWILNELNCRVYIRHPEHLQIVRSILQQAGIKQAAYVKADICRAELLLEIEATASHFNHQFGNKKTA